MIQMLVLIVIGLVAGNAACFYARAKGIDRMSNVLGTLAFLLPISLPLITLYLLGRPLPAGNQVRPPVVVALTVGNVLAVILIVILLASLADG